MVTSKRWQHRGQLLLIANIQRSRHSILEVWPEYDHEEKPDNMYLTKAMMSYAYILEDRLLHTDLEEENPLQAPIDSKCKKL
jgi:hypothetical protein